MEKVTTCEFHKNITLMIHHSHNQQVTLNEMNDTAHSQRRLLHGFLLLFCSCAKKKLTLAATIFDVRTSFPFDRSL